MNRYPTASRDESDARLEEVAELLSFTSATEEDSSISSHNGDDSPKTKYEGHAGLKKRPKAPPSRIRSQQMLPFSLAKILSNATRSSPTTSKNAPSPYHNMRTNMPRCSVLFLLLTATVVILQFSVSSWLILVPRQLQDIVETLTSTNHVNATTLDNNYTASSNHIPQHVPDIATASTIHTTHTLTPQHHVAKTNITTTRRHVVLIGPHDRFNFGDLLFEKVVSKLLQTRAGYQPHEIHTTGIVTTNMSEHGGHEHIVSISTVIELSRNSSKAFDVIYLGGEALGCNYKCGVRMLPPALQSHAEKVTNCAYLFPKSLLHNNKTAQQHNNNNVAIVNSLGIRASRRRAASFPCLDALDEADFIAFRDLLKPPHSVYPHAVSRPDSAVLTKYLLSNHYYNTTTTTLSSTIPKQPYVAIQLKSSLSTPIHTVAAALNEVYQHTNYTLVFFRAGSVAGHDRLEYYHELAQHLPQQTAIDTSENVWDVVGLIAHAQAVVSTSLHVRIMAFVHQRARVTICTGPKHRNFVQQWEAPDHAVCVSPNEVEGRLWETLQQSIASNQSATERAVQHAVDMYLEGFDKWSKLLNRP